MTNSSQNALVVSGEQAVENPALESWKIKALAIGSLVGAGVGLLSAFLLIKNSERTGAQPTMSVREGFKIAVLSVGIIRNIANLWED